MDPVHPRFSEHRYPNHVTYDFENASVREIVDFLNNQEPDPFVGHMYGINAVNQVKDYISNNSMLDIINNKYFGDKYWKNEVFGKDKQRIVFVYTQLMAHYLLQDEEFVEWMNNYDVVLFEPRI